MVGASLVTDLWPEVEALRHLLQAHRLSPSLEAFFVTDNGDWRLLAVVPDPDRAGAGPIYSALETEASETGTDISLLSRLTLLAQDDPDAAPLANSPVVTSTPPRRLDARVPSLAGYSGAVLHRAEAPRFQRFQAEVVSALVDDGLLTKQAAENTAGEDVDFVIEAGPDRQVLIEIKLAERRNLRYRIAEALGIANLWGRPLVLILGTGNPRGLGLVESIGFVPVFPVDWTRDGVAGVRAALARASAWSPSHPPLA